MEKWGFTLWTAGKGVPSGQRGGGGKKDYPNRREFGRLGWFLQKAEEKKNTPKEGKERNLVFPPKKAGRTVGGETIPIEKANHYPCQRGRKDNCRARGPIHTVR